MAKFIMLIFKALLDMKKNFIITGAAGHLAGVIIRKLGCLGCYVRGLVLPNEEGPEQENAEYIKGDITSPETLDPLFSGLDPKETFLIHTAGLISVQEKVSPLVKKVNVDGTKNIIAKCIQYGISRLVYVSSVHAIPEKGKWEEVSEISDFDPDKVEGAYAKTKAMATKAVLEAGKDGLDVVVVHPSGIIGPYDDGRNHLVQLFQMYLRGKLPAVVTGGFDFVDVRDLADGILSAGEKGRSGECYILSNRYFTMKEIAEYMRLALGRKCKLPALPLGFVKTLAYFFDFIAKIAGIRNIFTPYSFATLGTTTYYSHYKATVEFGYHPRDMKQTVKDTMDYLKGRLK